MLYNISNLLMIDRLPFSKHALRDLTIAELHDVIALKDLILLPQARIESTVIYIRRVPREICRCRPFHRPLNEYGP
jgi:hypothetical protein